MKRPRRLLRLRTRRATKRATTAFIEHAGGQKYEPRGGQLGYKRSDRIAECTRPINRRDLRHFFLLHIDGRLKASFAFLKGSSGNARGIFVLQQVSADDVGVIV